MARHLVDIAVQSGADSVKFQIIYPDVLYLPEIFENGSYSKNEVFEARSRMMLSDNEWLELSRYCEGRGIPASASVFDIRGLLLLDSWNPPYIKIASCDLNFSELLKEAASHGRRIILSTGMATEAEIENAVGVLERTGHRDIVLMHCVSAYPCPLHDMNLRFLEFLGQFGYPTGLSDHTESSLAAAVAVGMGVQYIEKHFTYDRSAQGFDHAYAMDPQSLTQYISDIRDVERSLQPRPGKLSETEKTVAQRARRSLYAARDLEPGEVIQADDVLTVRPQHRLRPDDISRVLGAATHRPIRRYEPIPEDLIS
jgi:sialic acid synthase SpsE